MLWYLAAAGLGTSLAWWVWSSATEDLTDYVQLLEPTTHVLGPTKRHTTLTWNTHGLDLLPMRPDQHRHRLARLRHILDHERPETVALQEVFCLHWRWQATMLLRSRGFWVATTTHGEHRLLRRSSGLLLASQQKLRSVRFERFEHCCGEDALVSKGVLSAELADGSTVATVHLQSDSWFSSIKHIIRTREMQMSTLLSRTPAIDLVLGDFNMSYLEWANHASIRPYLKITTPPTWRNLCLDAVLCRTPVHAGDCRLVPVRSHESDHHALLYQHQTLW